MRYFLPFHIILVALILFGDFVLQRTPKVWKEVQSISAGNFVFNIESIENRLSDVTERDISEFKKWRPSTKVLQQEDYLYIFIWKTLFFERGNTRFPENITLSEKGRDVVNLWVYPESEDSIANLLDKIQLQEGNEPFDLSVIRFLVSIPDKNHEYVLHKLKEYIDPEHSVFNATGIYGEEMLEVIRYIKQKTGSETVRN